MVYEDVLGSSTCTDAACVWSDPCRWTDALAGCAFGNHETEVEHLSPCDAPALPDEWRQRRDDQFGCWDYLAPFREIYIYDDGAVSMTGAPTLDEVQRVCAFHVASHGRGRS